MCYIYCIKLKSCPSIHCNIALPNLLHSKLVPRNVLTEISSMLRLLYSDKKLPLLQVHKQVFRILLQCTSHYME